MKASLELRLVSLLALFPVLPLAQLDCSKIVVDGKAWDLSKLGGPRSVYHVVDHPPSVINTTYTLDICRPLPKNSQCPSGTYVCGIERTKIKDGTEITSGTIPIAGNYAHSSGRSLDPKITRLKSSDSEQEGLRIELHGGKYLQRSQQAVIEMICDKDRTGLDDDDEDKQRRRKREDGEPTDKDSESPEGDDKNDSENNKSLQFKSYGEVDKINVLRLDWRTKYACEGFQEGGDGKKSNHWGFFTWVIILLFLCVAAYLIFGSWLNYNRYGARGWDLLPHGDTVRDIPYLMKDWGRKVINTLQGPGSRGGYSAV
ncbi:type II membrane protein [Emydomyces testavorans]|uniref:Autophagy-related protein 27 n=1 Tax=Emydomyces testavorans TaxID=2070801 RepID=A0AAF0DAW4_9EURO|nr:type II membrane protein [Emydomyces testavorans]